MTFKEKIDKILEINQLGIDSVTALEDKVGAGRGAINDFYKENRDPGRKTLKRILSFPGLNKQWWETGNGEMFIAASAEKHTYEPKEPAITQNSWEVAMFRKIMEGDAEYVLVDRAAFNNHRFTSVEQIEANARELAEARAEVQRLAKEFIEFVKDTRGLGNLPDLPKVQETKKDATV